MQLRCIQVASGALTVLALAPALAFDKKRRELALLLNIAFFGG